MDGQALSTRNRFDVGPPRPRPWSEVGTEGDADASGVWAANAPRGARPGAPAPAAVAGADRIVCRLGRQLGERALHDDAAVIDDRDRVADLLHLVEQVRESSTCGFRDEP